MTSDVLTTLTTLADRFSISIVVWLFHLGACCC